jgi:hypothetical protein
MISDQRLLTIRNKIAPLGAEKPAFLEITAALDELIETRRLNNPNAFLDQMAWRRAVDWLKDGSISA